MPGAALVLLDVDGVINALWPKPKVARAWGEPFSSIVEMPYSITYNPALVRRLAALTEVADVQWLTTWMERANGLADRIGLPQLPVAATPAEYLSDTRERWWKLNTAIRVAGERPLVWLDDDLTDREARAWCRARSAPTLALAPHYKNGLIPRELDRIEEFVAAYQSEEQRGEDHRAVDR